MSYPTRRLVGRTSTVRSEWFVRPRRARDGDATRRDAVARSAAQDESDGDSSDMSEIPLIASRRPVPLASRPSAGRGDADADDEDEEEEDDDDEDDDDAFEPPETEGRRTTGAVAAARGAKAVAAGAVSLTPTRGGRPRVGRATRGDLPRV